MMPQNLLHVLWWRTLQHRAPCCVTSTVSPVHIFDFIQKRYPYALQSRVFVSLRVGSLFVFDCVGPAASSPCCSSHRERSVVQPLVDGGQAHRWPHQTLVGGGTTLTGWRALDGQTFAGWQDSAAVPAWPEVKPMQQESVEATLLYRAGSASPLASLPEASVIF